MEPADLTQDLSVAKLREMSFAEKGHASPHESVGLTLLGRMATGT